MKSVFLLQHSYEINECEEIKTIGIYSTKAKANEVIERYKTLPGFIDYKDSFYVDEYEIDEDNWSEGFVKV